MSIVPVTVVDREEGADVSQVSQPVVVNAPVVGQDVGARQCSTVMVWQIEAVLVELDLNQLLKCRRPHPKVSQRNMVAREKGPHLKSNSRL